jgi:guanylate kinase
MRKSKLFIISAPSGAGKSTLIQHLLSELPSLLFSVSHTTRKPREGEKNEIDYFFVGYDEFQRMIAADEFLEWASVHGSYYGTSKEMLRSAEKQNKDLLLDIDVQGAAKVRGSVPAAVSIFVMPPSFEALVERLRKRQKDSPEQMEHRIQNARTEMQHYNEYDYVLINENLDNALKDLVGIITGKDVKKTIPVERIGKILKSFDNAVK